MVRLIKGLSALIAKLERMALIVLALLVTVFILLNVVTRSLNVALYWVDELAIYSMIWMVMIGASTKIHHRQGISVNLAQVLFGENLWRMLKRVVDVLIFLFSITLVWLAWIWYDPLTLASLNFDTEAFSQDTFNFIYQEPTLTIGVPKYLVWLVMPLTALTMTIHSCANLFKPDDQKGTD